jgi:hypothetical protein
MTLIFQIPYQTGVSFIADKRRIRKINGRTIVPEECKNDAEKLFGYNGVIVGFYGKDYTDGTTFAGTIKRAIIELDTDISMERLKEHLLSINSSSLDFASTPIDIREAKFIIAIKREHTIFTYMFRDGEFILTEGFHNVGISIYRPIFSIIKGELSVMKNLNRKYTEMLGAILIDMFYQHCEYETIELKRGNIEEIKINHSKDGGLNAISLDVNSGVTEVKTINETPDMIRFICKLFIKGKIKNE